MKFVINKNELLKIIILCFIFFPLVGMSKIIRSDFLVNVFCLFSTFIITVLTIRDIKKVKFDITIILLISFNVYLFGISLINSTLTYGISYCLYFNCISSIYIVLSVKKKDYSIFKAIYFLYSMIICLNFPSVIKALSLPVNNRGFLIGGKNSLTIVCISSIFYTYLYYYLKNKKINIIGFVVIIINILSLFFSGSSTAFVIGLIMILFIFLPKSLNISIRVYAIIYVIIQYIVFNIRYIGKNSIINYFVTQELDKDLTLSGRTYIWENVINYIKLNPFGYGRGNMIVYSFSNVSECHNAILELILSGGIVCLIVFIIYVLGIFGDKSRYGNCKIINMSKFIVFAILVLGLTESIIYDFNLWWILIISYAITRYNNESEKKNNDNSIHADIQQKESSKKII